MRCCLHGAEGRSARRCEEGRCSSCITQQARGACTASCCHHPRLEEHLEAVARRPTQSALHSPNHPQSPPALDPSVAIASISPATRRIPARGRICMITRSRSKES